MCGRGMPRPVATRPRSTRSRTRPPARRPAPSRPQNAAFFQPTAQPSRAWLGVTVEGDVLPVQRVAHLGAQRVARAEAARQDAELRAGGEQGVPQAPARSFGGDQLVAPLAGVAGAAHDDRRRPRVPPTRPRRTTCSRARPAAPRRPAPRRSAGPARPARRRSWCRSMTSTPSGRVRRAAGGPPRRCWPRWGPAARRRRRGGRRSGRRRCHRSSSQHSVYCAWPGAIRPRSLLRQCVDVRRRAGAAAPAALPRWLTSKMPDAVAHRGVLARPPRWRTPAASTSRRTRRTSRRARRAARAGARSGAGRRPSRRGRRGRRDRRGTRLLGHGREPTQGAGPAAQPRPARCWPIVAAVTDFSLRSANPAKTRADAVVVGVVQGRRAPSSPPAPRRSPRRTAASCVRCWPRSASPARPGRWSRCPTAGTLKPPLLVLVGLGAEADGDAVRAGRRARRSRRHATRRRWPLALPADDAAEVAGGHRGLDARRLHLHVYSATTPPGRRPRPARSCVLTAGARRQETQDAFAAGPARRRAPCPAPATGSTPRRRPAPRRPSPSRRRRRPRQAAAGRPRSTSPSTTSRRWPSWAAAASSASAGVLGDPPRLVELSYSPEGRGAAPRPGRQGHHLRLRRPDHQARPRACRR